MGLIIDSVLDLGKKKQRRTLDRVGGVSTVIGSESNFEGKFSGDENCIIYGRVEGSCDVNGTVVVEEKAYWQGILKAEYIIIAGEVNGDIIATKKIEIAPSAKIVGDICGPVIAIAQGAVIKGRVQMTDQLTPTHFTERRNREPELEED